MVKDEPVFVSHREVDTALYTNSGSFDTDRKGAGRGGNFRTSEVSDRTSVVLITTVDRNQQERILPTKMVVLKHVDTVEVSHFHWVKDCPEKESSALVSQDDVPRDIEGEGLSVFCYVVWSTH